jgi:RNA polymerase sigma-70 factor (ECF subfamily)
LDEANELSLMRRVADKDVAAYRALVELYLPRITRFAQRLLGNASEAEDVVQETFLRLWTSAGTFTPKAKPSSWLYRIAHNLCIDRFRRRKRETELGESAAADRPSGLMARKQTAEIVQAALAALPERQRTAILLVHYEGLAAAEAAAVLEVSVEALESLLSRARRTLRERLAAHSPEPSEDFR